VILELRKSAWSIITTVSLSWNTFWIIISAKLLMAIFCIVIVVNVIEGQPSI